MGKWIWLFFLQQKWFSGLTHVYSNYISNMIFAVKNLGLSHHTSVVAGHNTSFWKVILFLFWAE